MYLPPFRILAIVVVLECYLLKNYRARIRDIIRNAMEKWYLIPSLEMRIYICQKKRKKKNEDTSASGMVSYVALHSYVV